MKKLAVLMLAASIILSMTACKDDAKKTQESSGENEVSISLYDRGLISAEEGTYEENRWTKWVDENSGIDVTWVPVQKAEYTQSLNVLFASKSAPDMIMCYDRQYFQDLADQKLITPIGEYVDQYSTVYKEFRDAHPELKPFTTLNNEQYLATTLKEARENHNIWIRQDWLDKLGLKAPETVEDMVNVARAFKEQDPDGNGENDTLGIVARTDIFEELFMVDQQWYVEDGKIYNPQFTDRYVDLLKLRKQLFDENIVDREYLTDSNNQRQKQKWITGKAGIYFAQWKGANDLPDLYKNAPEAVVAPLRAPATKYGRNGLHKEPPAGMYVALNSEAKSPETAVKFMDWMLDKGWSTLCNGLEGVNYNMVNDIPVPIDFELNKKQLSWAEEMPFLKKQKITPEYVIARSQNGTDIDKKIAQLEADALNTLSLDEHRQDIPFGILPTDPEVKRFMTEWKPIQEEIKTQVIFSSVQNNGMTPEKGVEKMKSEWERLGGLEIEKKVQQWYDENKELLTNFGK